MFEKRFRVLSLRWGILAGGLTAIAYTLYWLVNGSLHRGHPLLSSAAHHIAWASDTSRFFDPLIVLLLTWVYAWVCFNYDPIVDTFGPGLSDDYLAICMVCGTIIGLVGCVFVYLDGFEGILVGSIVLSLLIFLYSKSFMADRWQAFCTNLTAVWVIWFLGTLIAGTVPAAIYAMTTLAASATVHFGLFLLCWTIKMTFRHGGGAFGRYMLGYEPETTDDTDPQLPDQNDLVEEPEKVS